MVLPKGRLRTGLVCLAAGSMLAGCVATGESAGGVASVNGDTPIASGVGAMPGSNEDFIINVGRRVFFTDGSAGLSGTAKVTLDKQAAWLSTYPDKTATIEGYADEKGGAAVNRALGLRRADAIAAYLEGKGVAAARLRTETFGNERPVRSCNDISCWSQNRRGVTVLDTTRGA